MPRKISLKIAKVLIQLAEGQSIAASKAKGSLINQLIEEDILLIKGKHRKTIQLRSQEKLGDYLANQQQIFNLATYVEALENDEVERAELVEITTDSKVKNIRSFKGFLVNSYQPIQAKLNGEAMVIAPPVGTFQFIYDFENFVPDKEVVIVGIENPTNFRWIERQQHLFGDILPLFISRYPQSQHKDTIKWLQSISNPYLHFGDFDLAGIGIFLNEYKRYLAGRATFFIPDNIEILLKRRGNRERFDRQRLNFDRDSLSKELKELVDLIFRERKGLDQEYLIGK